MIYLKLNKPTGKPQYYDGSSVFISDIVKEMFQELGNESFLELWTLKSIESYNLTTDKVLSQESISELPSLNNIIATVVERFKALQFENRQRTTVTLSFVSAKNSDFFLEIDIVKQTREMVKIIPLLVVPCLRLNLNVPYPYQAVQHEDRGTEFNNIEIGHRIYEESLANSIRRFETEEGINLSEALAPYINLDIYRDYEDEQAS